MHPSDRAALRIRVGEVVNRTYIEAGYIADDPHEILDCIADAVMEIIEEAKP